MERTTIQSYTDYCYRQWDRAMPSPPQYDRRQFSRIEFDADVYLVQNKESFQAQLLDISLNGVLLRVPTHCHVHADTPCRVSIKLADAAEIVMQVTLIHSSPELLGFHCISIDMDSIIHLRRLIEFNLGDPQASERVLAELLKRHEKK